MISGAVPDWLFGQIKQIQQKILLLKYNQLIKAGNNSLFINVQEVRCIDKLEFQQRMKSGIIFI